MPSLRDKSSSTLRRKRLADFIDSAGDTMVKPCQTCEKRGRVCKVHIRSGKCSECLRRGQRCDLRVTQSEWDRLKNERLKIRRKLQDSRRAQDQARAVLTAEHEKEMRLRQQLDLLEEKEAEAIAVEEANIEEQEAEERESAQATVLLEGSHHTGLHLAPSTWNALEGGFDMDDDFWNIDPSELAGITAA